MTPLPPPTSRWTPSTRSLRVGIDATAAALCAVAALLTLSDIATPVRTGVTVVALVMGTGWAATCWITSKDAAFALTLTIAAGISILCLYALLFVEIHWWHPVGSVGALLIAAAAVNVAAIIRDLGRESQP